MTTKAPKLNPEIKIARMRIREELQWAGQARPNQEFWEPHQTKDKT